ncbi:MAG: UDP-N-acetylglucosamine--N-acetylmuramyl-(pentapeptide) pyrophosphoryl-undecaprenol N-acetylglucosamine transferase [Spirochaetaceae bacterium]|jgi:UDP-N-acetylglucosamine--N-acetylmuramyl-(pentapeptide) pyrophosphoryl-undecaprenol N-acetylglucosamine transferase|nr:UDP-N-acetylglucosamine--N-acetylmuramyl-(pentapeptide) pyrophosphoryl-undecaprenol N-acetylglucosamine transferase [Spirochaetaceae bacterium]
MKTLVFTGGGTGGHIYPGLAVIDELQKVSDYSVVWLGSSTGVDRKIVEDHGVSFVGVPSGKLRRYLSFQNMLDLFKIAGGFFASVYHLARIKPAAVFSKGGFVSVPPCFAARFLRIPVYSHECDFSPGLATRLNARIASRIFVSYQETSDRLMKQVRCPVTVSGNPVRPVFYDADPEAGREFLGLNGGAAAEIPQNSLPLLLVLGGSLGARQINSLIAENLEWLCRRFIVVHQTGGNNMDQAADVSGLPEEIRGRYKPYAYLRAEMPHVLAAADIVVSRSGANSLWECGVVGKPMILIPLSGSGTRGDQVENAEYFRSKGAASVLCRNRVTGGNEVTGENLRRELEALLSNTELRVRMGEAAMKITGGGGSRPAAYIANALAGGTV